MTNVKDLGYFSFHSLSYDIPEALIHCDILYVVYLTTCLGQRIHLRGGQCVQIQCSLSNDERVDPLTLAGMRSGSKRSSRSQNDS